MLPHPKKVGTIPVGNNSEEVKQTNEIKVAAPLLAPLEIENKDITADALHTQWKLARYLVEERKAHYYFTVKDNQPTLLDDISFHFKNNKSEPEAVDISAGDHGRIETRKIWTTSELNEYVSFPHVGQAFAIEREFIDKRTGAVSKDLVYGITSRKKEEADPNRILKRIRGHWSIENSCHYILDWNYDEDRCRIRTGYGPENITRLRKFAISVIKSKKVYSVAQKMRELSFNVRAVFDYLKMTKKFQTTIAE
ncbi:MAG: ISAs1 family transposase [Candidatus Pacebacteria bacterium]|jgi:predicted transposase YbfD/YdcC|nr:ISAs1 family transposase [Candidatus Paceibacterota bacterium]|tara:strand:- start:61 stop:816 length:756 start_codon:yes stop_codon:yes gene_type:complete